MYELSEQTERIKTRLNEKVRIDNNYYNMN